MQLKKGVLSSFLLSPKAVEVVRAVTGQWLDVLRALGLLACVVAFEGMSF